MKRKRQGGKCMRCPKCGATKSSVVDSRQAEEGNTIRRRRECDECQHRFTTYERVEERTLVVVKKDGTREQFSRDKIFNGIIRSAQKRPVSSDEINMVVNRIEQKLRGRNENEIQKELEKECGIALKQIEEKKYSSVLKNAGIDNILKIGLAFFGKEVKIKFERGK